MGFHFVTFLLVIVGALNWLLLGVFDWELGRDLLGGQDDIVSRVIYVAIGLAGVYEFATHKKNCKACGAAGKKK